MNICEHLSATANLFPERDALCFQGERFRYAYLDHLTRAAANRLSEAGIGRGDRVAIMLPNVPAFVVWYYATLRLGAIAVSVNMRLAPPEVAFVLDDCGAKAFVSSQDILMRLSESIPATVSARFFTCDRGKTCHDQPLEDSDIGNSGWVDTEPDEPALILYTSGTTGFPKGATLSHANVRSNVCAFNHLCNMQPDDRLLLAVPLFHCFGQNALLNSALNVGATLVLQQKFDLAESQRLIVEENITQIYGVPMMFQLLLDRCEAGDLSSVNYCFSAAAPLPIQVSERWQQKFGMPLNEGYGLTETSPFASYNHRVHFVPGSIGTPIDNVEMKIVSTESGETCAPGQLGEIAIRGPNVMLGYWNRPDDTQAAIRDGWFYSGDIGRVDEKGYYYIVDRVKDMIAVGGMKVFPAEVERVLLDFEQVQEAAVVGLPNDIFGEAVVAFVVLAEKDQRGAQELLQAILADVRKQLATYKVPQRIVLLDELPRNPSGKILKTQLREFDLEGDESRAIIAAAKQGDVPTAPRSDATLRLRDQLLSTHPSGRKQVAVAYVQELVRSVSEPEGPIETDTRFLDAGLDSLMIVELSNRVQTELGSEADFSATMLFDHPRVCDLADFLVATLVEDLEETVSKSTPTEVATDSPNKSRKNDTELYDHVAAMSEEEATAELMRELEDP